MDIAPITFDRAQARVLWRQYRKDQHYSTPLDAEIARVYQHIARGRTVIRALEAIRAAGLDAKGYPHLAIARADAEHVTWRPEQGAGTFRWNGLTPRANANRSKYIRVEWPGLDWKHLWGEARLPIIPLGIRPKRALASYHVLWEAQWTPAPPVDPLLLRRIGLSDAWVVVAAWELTAVERAVLATRIGGR